MPYETITFTQEDALGIITLKRPKRLNTLNVQMVKELRQAIDHISNDDSLRVVIVTGDSDGKGKPCFCAGADMKEAPFPDSFLPELNDLFNRIEDLGKATVAAIDGVCVAGGLELAMCFDLRVVAETAGIGDLHLKNLGVGLGGAGASTRLPRIVGLAHAKELMFTGGLIDGREAYRIGLANRVCPSDSVMHAARELGTTIAAMRPRGLAVAKMHLNMGTQMELHQALRFAETLGLLADAEGMQAVEKRQLAFAAQSAESSGKQRPGNPPLAEPAFSGTAVPIKPGLFTLPSSPGEPPRLIGSKCRSCGEVYFPSRKETNCPHCYEADMEELLLRRTGIVLSYTIVHQGPREWQGPVPYAVALIESPEKARFYSALTGGNPKEVAIGMEVELVIEKLHRDARGNDVVGYKFRPRGEK